MTGSIQICEKLHFNPKSRLNVVQGQTSKKTDWHIVLGLKIDILIACRRLSVSPQDVECVSRNSASGHLQKFAADLSLSTPQNSQPCKIVTLSLNSNQNLHSPAP